MKKRNLKKPVISALEQRILFDGAAVATAVDVLDNSSFTPTSDSTTVNDVTNNNAENSVHEAQAVQSFEKPRREVAFVDVTVSDYQTLVDGIGEGVETYLVSSMDDINAQVSAITEAITSYTEELANSLGGSINPDAIRTIAVNQGAKRTNLREPSYTQLEKKFVPKCILINCNFLDLEDD